MRKISAFLRVLCWSFGLVFNRLRGTPGRPPLYRLNPAPWITTSIPPTRNFAATHRLPSQPDTRADHLFDCTQRLRAREAGAAGEADGAERRAGARHDAASEAPPRIAGEDGDEGGSPAR